MSRNVLIVYLSLLSEFAYQKNTPIEYSIHASDSDKYVTGLQTNEAAVQYLINKLSNNQEKLSKIIVFCSDSVRAENLQKEKDGTTPISTLAYFRSQVQEYLGNTGNIHEIIKVIETKDTMEIGDQIDAMEKLNQYLFKKNDNNAFHVTKSDNFYIDFTGGKRDSAMLLINIMHLLEFKHLKVKEVNYSEILSKKPDEQITRGRLVDCTHLYKMADFISAMDDFFSFGSAKKLVKIFTDIQNEQLRQLIESLDTFSKHLSLCRVDLLEKDTQMILTCFSTYRQGGNNAIATSDERFFRILIGRMEDEFEGIFDTKTDTIIDICKWCYNKGMLQQALSIINEKFPSIVCQHFLFEPYQEYVKKLTGKEYINCRDVWPCVIFKNLFHKKNNLRYFLTGNINYDTRIDAQLLCNMINAYGKINKERNSTNHAGSNQTSTEEVEKMIKSSIQSMDELLEIPKSPTFSNIIKVTETFSYMKTNSHKLPFRPVPSLTSL